MHGTIMLLLFATPILFAFANYIVPLQIGAPDVAFPRLNAFAYWLFLFGGSIVLSGFLTPGGAADFGWFAYTPLSDACALARRRRRPVDHRPGGRRSGHDPRRGQHDHHDRHPARARHDDVPDADLHLEHPGHQRPDPAGVPGAHRGAARPGWPTGTSARTCSTRPTAARSCGSTCSGSSATPRSTSSRCRSSASSPRSSRSSAASRSSATRAWSSRRSAIAALSLSGVGAPHVRHRPGAAAVLLVPDLPDRGADRHEVLQLDRHDVARARSPSRRRCCSRSASW